METQLVGTEEVDVDRYILSRFYVSFPGETPEHETTANLARSDSTVIMSCLRIGSLTRYATTHNPTYDTLSSAVWSSIEVDVGVFCICMPAFRRFLSYAMPKCFGTTTQGSTPMNGEAPMRLSNGRRHTKRKSAIPTHLYNTTMVKTVDTRVSWVGATAQEDEMQLMEISKNGST